MKNRDAIREPLIFLLLLAIGVLGRWFQPTWHFTPLAAVSAVGAFYFTSWWPTLLLPFGVLTVSNILLPSYDNGMVQAAVFAMMLVPLMLGRAARSRDGVPRAVCWGLCGFVPATLFYLVTNFAVWAFKSDYPSTLAGLMQSYAAGLPFYRTMLAGDLFYLGVMLSCLAIAARRDTGWFRRRSIALVEIRK